MQWNTYLVDSFAWLFLLIPASLVAAKIGFPKIPWWILWLSTSVLSWLVTFGYFWAFPPDNGFGTVFGHLFGWVFMLPILGIFSTFWFFRKWRGSGLAKAASVTFAVASFALPIRACFRWLPEDEVKGIAAQELRQAGAKEFRITRMQKTREGWTVQYRFANGSTLPLYLSRSGYCTGIGG